MALKQDGVNFVLCPKQGNKIEGFSQPGYVFKDFFLPKQGQGFKPSATNLYPVEWSSTPPHLAQLCSNKSRRNHQSCV